ncbi:MAG TPA: anti-sigma factor [Nevskiaceae bacterium]|nr:anti-sigma factor [Nevskiaceae bacterium]
MRYESPKLRSMLAAEYVLGTLQGPARRRFLRMMGTDRWLRGEVRFWEQRFSELSLFEPVPPRPIVWAEIERRMKKEQEEKDSKIAALFKAHDAATRTNAIRFWRTWAVVSTAAAIVFAAIAVKPQAPTVLPPQIVEVKVPVQVYVAAIRLPNEDAQWNVSLLPEARQVRLLASDLARVGLDKDYELWWVSEDGGVTSLGLLPRKGASQRSLPATVQLRGDGKVAVSLEPAGGSPAEGGPSGPVISQAQVIPSI